MKQIITLNFGQTGINISNQTLTLYLRQHGISKQPNAPTSSQSLIQSKYNSVFFEQTQDNNICYRSISVDCDPYSSDQLLTSSNKKYYKQSRILCSNDSTGGIYTRGYAASKRQLFQKLQQSLHKTIQSCDNLQGIIVNTAMLGGAAGIFHHALGKIMGEDYLSKKIVISNLLFPSRSYGNSIVEIYNYTLSFRTLLQFSDLNIPYDNQCLYRMCQEEGIQNPGYSEINQLIAHMQSSITLPFRSFGPLNNNMNDLVTNLVCYPRINLTYPSCSSVNKEAKYQYQSVNQLTRSIFDPRSRLIDMGTVSSKIAIALYYRGDITPYQVSTSLKKVKDEKYFNCSFQQWSPLGFKVGINREESLVYYGYKDTNYFSRRSCCSLTSSMQFNSLLGHNNHKFDILYAKRAFVYTFLQDSLQQGQFSQARQDLAALQKDYQIWQGYVEEQQEAQD